MNHSSLFLLSLLYSSFKLKMLACAALADPPDYLHLLVACVLSPFPVWLLQDCAPLSLPSPCVSSAQTRTMEEGTVPIIVQTGGLWEGTGRAINSVPRIAAPGTLGGRDVHSLPVLVSFLPKPLSSSTHRSPFLYLPLNSHSHSDSFSLPF